MNEQTSCPLFRLPRELREWIYILCFSPVTMITDPVTDPEGYKGYVRNGPSSFLTLSPNGQILRSPHLYELIAPRTEVPLFGTSLARTCRRIHSELDVNKCLYAEHTFRFTHQVHALIFLNSLAVSQRDQMQHVVLDYCHNSGPVAAMVDKSTHHWDCTSQPDNRDRYITFDFPSRPQWLLREEHMKDEIFMPLLFLRGRVRMRVWGPGFPPNYGSMPKDELPWTSKSISDRAYYKVALVQDLWMPDDKHPTHGWTSDSRGAWTESCEPLVKWLGDKVSRE